MTPGVTGTAGGIFVGGSVVDAVGESVMVEGALVVVGLLDEEGTVRGRVDGACMGVTVGSRTCSGSKMTVGQVVFIGAIDNGKVGVGTSVV